MSSLNNFFADLINGPDFNKITSESRRLVDVIPAQLDGDIMALEGGYNTAISSSKAGVESSISTDLSARGISDPKVAKASVGNIQTGLSGAYATAHAALMGAKVNAKNKMAGAMSTYYSQLADKQYKSMMKAYAARMGMYGALGGAVGSGLGKKSNIKETPMESSETLITPNVNEIQTSQDESSYGMRENN